MSETIPSQLTIRCSIHLRKGQQGRVELCAGEAPPVEMTPGPGHTPRLSRLMALAIRFEDLLRRGEVKDYADLARLGHVTRARATQIMNLLLLAPDIQEAILFLPDTTAGHDPIKEWQVRPIAAEPVWAKQRKMWTQVVAGRRSV